MTASMPGGRREDTKVSVGLSRGLRVLFPDQRLPTAGADGRRGRAPGRHAKVAAGSRETVRAAAGVRARAALRVKHGIDRLFALACLLLLLPLLVVLAATVRLSSPGPALFRQGRVGRDGQMFSIWKFRTMTVDADNELMVLLQRHGRADSPLFKVPDDPRITRVGRWLRKTSLDELPQLFNVLQGHMSLVGPRPQRQEEVALYRSADFQRLSMKPGITGLWQVSGRSSLTWAEAVDFDLRYVREWSLWLDLRILVKTVRAVVRGDGAV